MREDILVDLSILIQTIYFMMVCDNFIDKLILDRIIVDFELGAILLQVYLGFLSFVV